MSDWWQEFFLSGSYTLLEDLPPERTEAQVEFVIRALSLKPGARVLDVACGIGRHSLPLAERGLGVVGLDYAPAYLQRALSGADNLSVHFLRGDMRRLPFSDAHFDAALNLFTSFGYLENDEANAAVLQEIARVLRPGGRLLLDIQNRDGIACHFRDKFWHALPDGYLLEEPRWDARSGFILGTWTFLRGGEAKSFTVNVRVYTCPEIERMLNAAGMEVVEVWGDWEGSPLERESRRLIVKSEKIR